MIFYRRSYTQEYKVYLKNLGFKKRYDRFKLHKVIFKEKMPLFYLLLYFFERLILKIKPIITKFKLYIKTGITWDNKKKKWKTNYIFLKRIYFTKYSIWHLGKVTNEYRLSIK